MNANWYAVYTKPRWEKKVAATLTELQIENYCPLNRVTRQWSDRKKVVYEPLFTSYVFLRVAPAQHSRLRQVDGILNLVTWLGKPALIRDEEIDIIRNFLKENMNVKLEKTFFQVNDPVKVTQGIFMEQEGSVVAVKNRTVTVALPSLGYILYAELDKTSIARIPQPC